MSRSAPFQPSITHAGDATAWVTPVWATETIDRVWLLGTVVDGNDSALWRKDECGAWIHRLDYGRRNSEFGWEIHDAPASGIPGANLRPLQWQNHVDRLASETNARVTADGLRNSRKLLPGVRESRSR